MDISVDGPWPLAGGKGSCRYMQVEWNTANILHWQRPDSRLRTAVATRFCDLLGAEESSWNMFRMRLMSPGNE